MCKTTTGYVNPSKKISQNQVRHVRKHREKGYTAYLNIPNNKSIGRSQEEEAFF